MASTYLSELEARLREAARDCLRDVGPLYVTMVKQVKRTVKPPWWKLWEQARTEWVQMESAAVSAHLEESAERFDVVLDGSRVGWTWDGQGTFDALVVRMVDGRELMRGGRLTATPTTGSSISPEIYIFVPGMRP
jgi:hypothetical protein